MLLHKNKKNVFLKKIPYARGVYAYILKSEKKRRASERDEKAFRLEYFVRFPQTFI